MRRLALIAILAATPAVSQGWGGGLFTFPDPEPQAAAYPDMPDSDVPDLGVAPVIVDEPASAFGGEGAPQPGNGKAGSPAYDFNTDVAGEDGICLREIFKAQTRYGIPNNLLLALGLQEAGFNRKSGLTVWPWSVNAAGEGRVFKSRDAALSWVRSRQAAGVTSIDIGCMQINQKWHPDAFASLEAGFEARNNVDYSARFLLSLHEKTGDWMEAAGSYHSFNPGPRSTYLASLRKNLEVANARIEQFYAKAEGAGLTQTMLASAETGQWDAGPDWPPGQALPQTTAGHSPNPAAPPVMNFKPLPQRPGGGSARTARAVEPEEPFVPPAGPFWTAGLSGDKADLGDDGLPAPLRRSIYTSQDLEPVLPNFTPVF